MKIYSVITVVTWQSLIKEVGWQILKKRNILSPEDHLLKNPHPKVRFQKVRFRLTPWGRRRGRARAPRRGRQAAGGSVSVPGDRADGEVRGRLRLVHEKFQVNAALLSCHSHHWISLSLVTLVKQLRDEPNKKVKFIYSGQCVQHGLTGLLCQVAPPDQSAPRTPRPFLRGAHPST